MGLFNFFNKKKQRKLIAKQNSILNSSRKEQANMDMNDVRATFGISKVTPVYKEDRYSDMIRQTSFNPFNITLDPFKNQNLEFGDMRSIFKTELDDSFAKGLLFGMPGDQIVSGFAFNMIESYYNNAGYVPKAIMDTIIEQIYDAVKQSQYSNQIDNVDQLKYKMYWDLTHR